jgi:hypothetical protein
VVQAMLVASTGDGGRSGRSVRDGAFWVTSLVAGTENLGTLVWAPPAGRGDVDGQDRQLLERAAVVASLLLLFNRTLAVAEARVRGELLDDLLTPRRTPTRRWPSGLSAAAMTPANGTRSSSRTSCPTAGSASAPPPPTSRPPGTG